MLRHVMLCYAMLCSIAEASTTTVEAAAGTGVAATFSTRSSRPMVRTRSSEEYLTGSYKTGLFPKTRFANWRQTWPQKYVSVVALCRDVSPSKHQKYDRFGFGGIKRPF